MAAAPGVEAGVYGAGAEAVVNRRARSVRTLNVGSRVRELFDALLAEVQPILASHFGVALERHEPPQFLRYGEGDYFVAHQDGNSPLIRDESSGRRISVVVFVNACSVEPSAVTYGGGSLVLHGRYPDLNGRFPVTAEVGSLVAFRSETTHEVIPVTHGERYTVVSWFR